MIVIEDTDVEAAAALLGCTFDDDDKAFLKRTTSCHVHACPGSGKTTLLVAKLAILARRWPWRDRGVLVLSHTNVARQEVERRLTRDATGWRLLNYPHFIDTIQAFANRFLAIPYLRDAGIDERKVLEPRVDDELFEAKAWKRFEAIGWTNFPQARAYLKRRQDEGRSLVASLSYSTQDRTLVASGSLPGPTTDSGRQLRALKDSVSADGIFRYIDMFAFALASLQHHPYLGAALSRRFPWVFIDEMQDTWSTQESMLAAIFSTESIVQRLGDTNQGIFSDANDEPNTFVAADALELGQSHRLAPRIATFASRLTVAHPQTLRGNPSREDRRHTVFLFTDDTIHGVLPAFAELILLAWPDGTPVGFVAKAVGFRKKPSSSGRKPTRISDYWADFPADIQRDRAPRRTLAAAIHWARHVVSLERGYHTAHRAFLDAVAHLCEHQEGGRVTRQALAERLRDGRIHEGKLRALVTVILRGSAIAADGWPSAVDQILEAVALNATALTSRCREFLAWEEPGNNPAASGQAPASVYRHSSGPRAVDIVVSTIHGVKGETHDATLVLETFEREHDLKTILPRLLGKRGPQAAKAREVAFSKRAFVAITRAKELVCLAIHNDHVSMEERCSLQDEGWTLHDVAEAAVAATPEGSA